MAALRTCFVVISDSVDDSFEDLVLSIRAFCPGSDIAWYNSGQRREAPFGLERVLPDRPLKQGRITPAFFDTFEWAADRDYDCVVNVDTYLAFIKPGFLGFIESQLRDADYLGSGLRYRVPRISMWPPFRTLGEEREELTGILGTDHFKRAFGCVQVFGRGYISALLSSDRYPAVRAFVERNQRPDRSRTLHELILPTLAESVGVKSRSYPDHLTTFNRFRPFQSELDLTTALATTDAFFVNPIRRSAADPVRRFVKELVGSGARRSGETTHATAVRENAISSVRSENA
ncbi:hypothetical protein E1193_06555 [Micromonospora sp. KC606]|uniref:hypothetical protein n=1 Tax=Micromonospora sp. KC606 TaxID=2530379 RepID=UPI00104D557E|nr:hypothetical protein [Micromonospora sp. KC606]TDC84230.1 hypothetical protein E1193_06555 [Micromonospora sp. KC606]